MSLGFSRFGSVVLFWFAASWLGIPGAFAQGQAQPHRSIELTETNSAQILTNLNLLTNKKEGSRQLEDQLRSLKGLTTPSMDEGFSIPYATPGARPTKRVKEMMERRNNWAMTPEEINLTTGGFGVAEPLPGFSDDKNSSKKSLQQFYDALVQPGSRNQNGDRPGNNRSPLSKKSEDSFDSSNLDDDSNLPPALRDKTQKLKEMVNQDPGNVFNPARPRASFDNFFGLSGTSTAVPEQSLTTKPTTDSFLDQFKKGLDPTAALGLNPALNALVPNGASMRTVLSPDLGKLPNTLHKEQTLTLPNIAGTVPNPTALSDLNSAVLNQWNPLYTPSTASKFEAPKPAPPTPINFEYPRRRF